MDINALRDMLAMYDREGLAAPASRASSTLFAGNAERGDTSNRPSERMAWAVRMAREQAAGQRRGQQPPSFFDDDEMMQPQSPAYVEPRMREVQRPAYMRGPMSDRDARFMGSDMDSRGNSLIRLLGGR